MSETFSIYKNKKDNDPVTTLHIIMDKKEYYENKLKILTKDIGDYDYM